MYLNLDAAAVAWSELNEASGLEGFTWTGDLVTEVADLMPAVMDCVAAMSEDEVIYDDLLGDGGDVMLMLEAMTDGVASGSEGLSIDLSQADARYVEIVTEAGLEDFEWDGNLVAEAYGHAASLYHLVGMSTEWDAEIRSIAFDLSQMVRALNETTRSADTA